MIHLTLEDGTPVAINPLHIFAVKPVEGGAFIMANGARAQPHPSRRGLPRS